MDQVRSLILVTPFSTSNSAYPAAAYLSRYLKRRGREVYQADLSLETMLNIYSRGGLERLFAVVEPKKDTLSPAARRVWDLRERYIGTVDSVIRHLQGKDPAMSFRVVHREYLPRGENFDFNKGFDSYDGTGSTLPLHDRSRFICTQYLYDIAGLIREAVFPYFQITLVDRHYDDFVHMCATFDRMEWELERPPNILDELLYRAVDEHLETHRPNLVAVTVPFARNLYWALRIGKRVKEWDPTCKVAAGGGLFNTSMRHPNEPRLFNYIDYLALDDGERPMLSIVEHMEGLRDIEHMKRTFYRDENKSIAYSNGCEQPDAAHEDAGAPDYTGYKIDQYFSTLETVNINQRVRSEGWWNKLTMAHGCYWKKCSFCDIHLSYIGDYEPAPAKNLVDKVEEAIAQTGQTGFHFVDEALPPKQMRDFALEVLRRGLNITWHSMLRFDKIFTLDFCRLLAQAGMVGAFGGLEVASNRLLQMMKKGTTVEQVAVVAKNFQEAGIRVHAYLMYGFPTQTAQETVDALDVVRQLFKHGLLTSASWAKFGVTPHSPIGRDPAGHHITLHPVPPNAFIEQILMHDDPANDHEKFTKGLMQAGKYYGMGLHTDVPSQNWFEFPVPPPSIDLNLMQHVLDERARKLALPPSSDVRKDKRIIWSGGTPSVRRVQADLARLGDESDLVIHGQSADHVIRLPTPRATFLCEVITKARPSLGGPLTFQQLDELWVSSGAEAAEAKLGQKRAFDRMLESEAWGTLKEKGLAVNGVVKWEGKVVPTLRFLPMDGGPARAEIVVDGSGGQVALPMPARWATWLVGALNSTAIVPQSLDALATSFGQIAGVEAAKTTATDILMAPETWQQLIERGLAIL